MMDNGARLHRPGEVQVMGESVLLRGVAVIDAAHLVTRAIEHSPNSAHLARFRALRDELNRALAAAAISPKRNDETKPSDDEPISGSCDGECSISVAAAAELLGLSTRRVQQLASSTLGGQRRDHVWCLDRSLVIAHKQFRDQQKRRRDGH